MLHSLQICCVLCELYNGRRELDPMGCGCSIWAVPYPHHTVLDRTNGIAYHNIIPQLPMQYQWYYHTTACNALCWFQFHTTAPQYTVPFYTMKYKLKPCVTIACRWAVFSGSVLKGPIFQEILDNEIKWAEISENQRLYSKLTSQHFKIVCRDCCSNMSVRFPKFPSISQLGFHLGKISKIFPNFSVGFPTIGHSRVSSHLSLAHLIWDDV